MEDDSAFLHEVSSQPIPGQSGSKTGSDTDITEGSIDLDIGGFDDQESDDSEHDSPMVNRRKHFKNFERHSKIRNSKMSDQKKGDLPDQVLIYARILPQLAAIGKWLTAIEAHK